MLAKRINLLRTYGHRYRVEFLPGYDPTGRPFAKLDPRKMLIPCRRGRIESYSGGGRLLVARVLEPLRPRDQPYFDALTFPLVRNLYLFSYTDMGAIANMLRPHGVWSKAVDPESVSGRYRKLTFHECQAVWNAPKPAIHHQPPETAFQIAPQRELMVSDDSIHVLAEGLTGAACEALAVPQFDPQSAAEVSAFENLTQNRERF